MAVWVWDPPFCGWTLTPNGPQLPCQMGSEHLHWENPELAQGPHSLLSWEVATCRPSRLPWAPVLGQPWTRPGCKGVGGMRIWGLAQQDPAVPLPRGTPTLGPWETPRAVLRGLVPWD